MVLVCNMKYSNFSFVLCLNLQSEGTKERKGLMASEASHVLEAALEQMDGIIAGMLRGPGDLRTEKPFSSHWTSPLGAETRPLLDFFYFTVCALFFNSANSDSDSWSGSRSLLRLRLHHVLACE